MLYKNQNYHILLVEDTIDNQQVDLYHVINNYTGVIEHKTVILPDAMQTAEEFNTAMIELETMYKSDINEGDTLH